MATARVGSFSALPGNPMRGVRRVALIMALGAIGLGGCDSSPPPPPPPLDPSAAWAGVGSAPAVATATPDGRTRTVELRVAGRDDIRGFLVEHGAKFGIDGEGVQIAAAGELVFGTDPAAMGRVVIYRVLQGSVPIYGAELKVIVLDGEIRYIASSVPLTRQVSLEPSLDARAVIAALGARVAADPAPSAPALFVFDPAAVRSSEHDGRGGEGTLAYRLEGLDTELGEWAEIFVSAESGEVLQSTGTARTVRRRSIRHAGGVTDFVSLFSLGRTVEWLDELGPSVAAVPPPDMSSTAYTEAELAHTYLGVAYDFWFDLLGWDGMDGRGGRVVGFVDYSPSTPPQLRNAFHVPIQFDGVAPEGIVYHPGSVTLDTTVHEYTHGVLHSIAFSKLAAWGESGAVNEGLSDTFAALATPGAAQWQIGEDLPRGVGRDVVNGTTGDDTGAFCYRQRFGQSGLPECDDVVPNAGETCWGGSSVGPDWDQGGVHGNGAMLPRVAYLASVGSAAASAPPALCASDLEIRPVHERKVAYAFAVSLVLLENNSNLHDVAANVLASCRLVAATTFVPPGAPSSIDIEECSSLRNAFAAVGLATPDTDYDDVIDVQDNCPTVYNPEQDEVCTPDAGASDAGASDAGPGGGGPYPVAPPAEPECPPFFTSAYEHSGRGFVPGDWPLRAPNESERAMPRTPPVEWVDTFVPFSMWFRKSCRYGESRSGSHAVNINIYWQPYDPALYEPYQAFSVCEPHPNPANAAVSSTRQARVEIAGTDCSMCVLDGETTAFVQAMLPSVEALAIACP